MLSYGARIFLVVTAITPIGFTYAWAALCERNYSLACIVILVCIILVCLAIRFIACAQEKLSTERFTPTFIEAADSENIAFMLLYLLPLFQNELSSLNWNMTVPAIIIFAAVIWTGYGYHFNPLLGMIGWHFYKVGTAEGVTYILISKKELRAANQELKVGQLTEFIILDKGGK